MFTSYRELKKANPTFPILIRERQGIKPRFIARFGEPRDLSYQYSCHHRASLTQQLEETLPRNADFGVEESVPLEGLSMADVESRLQDLIKKGDKMPR